MCILLQIVSFWWASRISFSNLPTLFLWWANSRPFRNSVSTPLWWANCRPSRKSVSNLPTGGEIGDRLVNRYRICPPPYFGGQIVDRLGSRSRICPPYYIGGQIVDRLGSWYRICPPVGKLKTVSEDGLEFAHRWAKSRPTRKSVSKLPTLLYWWANSRPSRRSVSNLPTGGQIRDRLQSRSRICPLVGKFETVTRDGLQFAHFFIGTPESVIDPKINFIVFFRFACLVVSNLASPRNNDIQPY